MRKNNLTKQRLALGRLLEHTRLSQDLSRHDLAAAVGVTEEIVEKWETGQRTIDIVELRAYCGAVNIPLPEFVASVERTIIIHENEL